MAGLAYRVWFGPASATQEQLDRIEEIVVEQEMDMAWEARIRMYVCLDEKGRWQHGSDGFAAPFSRVRVELRATGETFTPLIDGPVISSDATLSSQPGASSVTIIVRDDSVLLNRKDDNEVFEGRRADEIARTVFAQFEEIGDKQVEPTAGAEVVAVRHGTAMALLRRLAHVHGYHAYVLPGPQGGKSIGCFKADPRKPGALAPLVLLGDDRNVADIEVRENSARPQTTVAHTLRLSDQQVVTAQSKTQDLTLLRPLPPIDDALLASVRVPPQDNDRDDPAVRTVAQTKLASYAYTATGRVVPGCYPGVLAPYECVEVRAGQHPQSGAWLLTKVTHRITPSVYTQEFQAKADSKEDPTVPREEASKPTGLSLEFSLSLSVL